MSHQDAKQHTDQNRSGEFIHFHMGTSEFNCLKKDKPLRVGQSELLSMPNNADQYTGNPEICRANNEQNNLLTIDSSK